MPRTPASSTGSICSCVNSIDSSPWGEMDSAKNVQHNCSHRRPHLVVPSSSSISSSTDSVTATGRPGNSFTECTTKPQGSKSSKSDSKPDSGAQALASFGFYATELDRAQVTGTPFPHSEGLRQVVPVARLTIVPANPHATTMAEWMDGAPPKSHAHLHVSGDAAPHWFSRIKEDGSTVPMLKGEMEWEECDAETLGRAESKSVKSARSSIRTATSVSTNTQRSDSVVSCDCSVRGLSHIPRAAGSDNEDRASMTLTELLHHMQHHETGDADGASVVSCCNCSAFSYCH